MRKFKSIVIMYRILVIAGMAGGFMILTGRSYPITQVSKPLAECKSVRREAMPKGCIIDIPKIVGGDSSKYIDQSLYQLVYSDLRGGTYDNGRDVANGSSPGVDIVSSKGTPVYAIGNGEVVQAGYKWGIGNSITIKHPYKGSYIYSSYSHLDEMYAKVGDIIVEGFLIGKVGNTGTTYGQYGNHLDFQITTTTQWFYPYSYQDCSVGLSYYDIVNSALCRGYMTTNTIDPIAFLETNGSSLSVLAALAETHGSAGGSTPQPIVEKTPKIPKTTITTTSSAVTTVVTTKPIVDTRDNPSDVDVRLITQQSKGTIKLETPVITQSSANVTYSSQPSNLYQYQVIGLNEQESVEVKRKFVFFIKVEDITNKSLYQGKLAHRILLRDSEGLIAFDSPVISYTDSGIIKVTALGLKAGYTKLNVEIAGQTLGSYGITLQ